MPPKLTAVTSIKLVPVINIVAPAAPKDGENEVIVGGETNVNPARPAVPEGVITVTVPEAPVPTTAVMVFAFTTVKEVADVPPNLTPVAPVKFAPDMVTVVPAAAELGLNEEMAGSVDENTKPAKVAVPPGVVTATLPDVPLPNTAVIVDASTTMNDAAAVPPKVTAVAPVKFVPLMVMVWSVEPVVGVNDVMAGAGMKVKPASVAVPTGVVTSTLPDAAELLTTAVIVVLLTTMYEAAAAPPKLTAVAQEKFVPDMVTVVPAAAEVGVKDVMAGAGVEFVKPARDVLPPGVTTATLPVEPQGTTAVIVVAFTTKYDVAAMLLNVTAVAPVKLVPVIVTVAPTDADDGEKEPMVGAA